MNSPHFILTNGRSGSNFFVQLINQHAHAMNYGEVLGPWTTTGKHILPHFQKRGGAEAFLDWMLRSRTAMGLGQGYSLLSRIRHGERPHPRLPARLSTTGVKDFFVNLERLQLLRYLEDRPEIRLVVLLRENHLERLVSSKVLDLTGVVASKRSPGADGNFPRLILSAETIIEELDEVRRENEGVLRIADRHRGPVYHIRYEEFFSGSPEFQKSSIEALLEFLGLQVMALNSEHRRLRRHSLDKVIENYDELKDCIASTEYRSCLPDGHS